MKIVLSITFHAVRTRYEMRILKDVSLWQQKKEKKKNASSGKDDRTKDAQLDMRGTTTKSVRNVMYAKVANIRYPIVHHCLGRNIRYIWCHWKKMIAAGRPAPDTTKLMKNKKGKKMRFGVANYWFVPAGSCRCVLLWRWLVVCTVAGSEPLNGRLRK